MSAKCGEKLAEEIENSLKIRTDPDLGTSSPPQVSGDILKTNKPRGIKPKVKEICGSARPISGLEKSRSRKKKKSNESDILAQKQQFPPHEPVMSVANSQ
ncbi:hypothetical protein ACP4OV_019215 [Aristida adscensionis]